MRRTDLCTRDFIKLVINCSEDSDRESANLIFHSGGHKSPFPSSYLQQIYTRGVLISSERDFQSQECVSTAPLSLNPVQVFI
jgi:hypothetical protein